MLQWSDVGSSAMHVLSPSLPSFRFMVQMTAVGILSRTLDCRNSAFYGVSVQRAEARPEADVLRRGLRWLFLTVQHAQE